ncbi:MAG: hypothetical protein ACRD5L_00525, partial [Bryobacteraceae bacterium]
MSNVMLAFTVYAALFAPMALAAPGSAAPAVSTLLDEGYREMYNLDFQAAHRSFQEWEETHSDDPLGSVSDGAAYL